MRSDGPRSESPSARGTDHTVGRLLFVSALKAEAAISRVRIVLAAIMLTRFIIIDPPMSAYLVAVPAAMVAFTFSAYALVRIRRAHASSGLLWISAIVDSGLAFFGLLNNVLTPWPGYPGTLNLPDTAILLIVIVAAGFRLSVAIAVLAGCLNGTTLAILILWEQRVDPALASYENWTVTMWFIMILGATLTSVISASRTRSVTHEAARDYIRVRELGGSIGRLLQAHHDAHSVLSSAMINCDMLARRSAREGWQDEGLIKGLRVDLETMASAFGEINHLARGDLDAALDFERVELAAAIEDFELRSRAWRSDISLRTRLRDRPLYIDLAGGEPAFRRILVNLLKNSLEGDGITAATEIAITLEHDATSAVITFEDDGPGLDAKSLKPNSHGIGLQSIERVIGASGGSMTAERAQTRGARLRLLLPLAAPERLGLG